MKRKIVRQGPSSYVVSLPSEWIKKNHLEKGDSIEMLEQDNVIEISSKKIVHKSSISVDITDFNRTSLLVLLISLYRRGYEEINLEYKKSEAIHHRTGKSVSVIMSVQDILSRFIGVEVVKQTDSKIQIRQISDDSVKDFDVLFRRVIFMLTDTFKELESEIEKKTPDILAVIESRYLTIRRFINYCIRLVHKGAVSDVSKAIPIVMLLTAIDRIIKSLKQFGREFADEQMTFSKNTHVLVKDLRVAIELYQKFYLSKDMSILDLLERNRQDVKKKLSRMPVREQVVIGVFLKISIETLQDMVEYTLRL
ncbi:MAG: AbrB/MazE/SpoVT family DNA-binding domain-containing protein [Candidatus Woesearchaeota archaeon]